MIIKQPKDQKITSLIYICHRLSFSSLPFNAHTCSTCFPKDCVFWGKTLPELYSFHANHDNLFKVHISCLADFAYSLHTAILA